MENGHVYSTLQNAALYVTEGEKNDVFYRHPKDKDGILSYYAVHHPAFYMAHLISCVLLMLLALIEKPAVFAVEEEDAITIHIPLEVILLLLPTADVILRAFWFRKKFFTHRTFLIALVLFFMFGEAAAVIIRGQNHLRVTRALRPILFIHSYVMSETRRTLRNIVKCAKKILDVVLVFLFMTAIFALIGYYLFAQTDPDYFSTVEQSYVSLFITLTTANHPDVLLEAYKSDGWSALFFIIFLVITLYLLTSVLLGVVYSNFSHARKQKFKKKFKHQREALKKAYDELVKNGDKLDIDTFLKFMLEYKPLMPKWKALCTFKALQLIARRGKCTTPTLSEHNPMPGTADGLTKDEFYNFYEALDLKWIPPPLKGQLPWYLRLSQFCYTLVENRFFKITLTMVVIANTLFLIIYTALEVPNGEQRYEVLRGVLWVSFLFVAVYCIEVILKVIGLGYKYFTEFWNLVDFAIIVTSLIMLFLEINPNYMLLFFRPVKLIRLLWLRKRYWNIVKALLFLKEKLISGIILLLVIYYFFAIIGMETFHAVVQYQCCDYNHTWYGVGEYYSGTNDNITANVYWLLNFNNIGRSFTTLFVLMVVNNWYVVMEGFAAENYQQTSTPAWLTRVYFISFYIVSLVVLQVIITFIVDAFPIARKIDKLCSKRKTGIDKNGAFLSSCYHPHRCYELQDIEIRDTEHHPHCCYELLDIEISDTELEILSEQRSQRWWQNVAYHIRMWGRINFESRQCVNQKYTCKGERKGGLDMQLYSDKIPKWEKQFEEQQRKEKPSSAKDFGDILISSCKCSPRPLLPQLPYRGPYVYDTISTTNVSSDRDELCVRIGRFFKGFLEYVFE